MQNDLHNLERPIEFLKDRYLTKKKANPAYSLSAYARDLGLSVSFLSRLLKGERPLTVKQAVQIASLLGLSTAQTETWVAQIVATSSKNAKISKKFKTSLENRNEKNLTYFEVERFKAISQWYHLAILNLTLTRGFDSKPTSIAKRLGISKLEAEVAVRRLLELGLLEQKGSKLIRAQASLFIKTNKSELAMREFHLQMIERAQAALKETDQTSFDRRHMPSTTLPVNLKKLPLLKERIRQFQLEFADLAKADHYDEVYQLNLHLFPLSKTKGETS